MNVNAKAWTPNPAASAWTPSNIAPVVKLPSVEAQVQGFTFLAFFYVDTD